MPIEIVDAVKESLFILEEAYGAERNIETDLGGFVVILEKIEDIQTVRELNLDVYNDTPEYVEKILISTEEKWIKALFLLSSDYAVVVVGKESIIQMNQLNF